MGAENQHHEFGPSKFPHFEKCLHYKSGEVGEAAHRGTLQHHYLEMLFSATDEETGALNEDVVIVDPMADSDIEIKITVKEWARQYLSEDGVEQEQVSYAYWKIKQIVSEYGVELKDVRTEQTVVIETSDMTMVDGTGDVIFVLPDHSKAVIIDYKSGMERDYEGQMKCYGLGTAQEFDCEEVDTVIVYGRLKKTTTPITYKREELQAYFDIMMGNLEVRDQHEPQVNDYCDWCAKSLSCHTRNKKVFEVKKVVEDSPLKGITYKTDISKVSDEKLALIYEFTTPVQKWCKSVKAELEKRMKSPEGMEGYVYAQGSTNKLPTAEKILDILEGDGMDLSDFLKACSFTQKSLKELLGGDKFKELILPEITKIPGKNSIKKVEGFNE